MEGGTFASCRIKSHKRRWIRLNDEMQLPEPKQMGSRKEVEDIARVMLAAR